MKRERQEVKVDKEDKKVDIQIESKEKEKEFEMGTLFSNCRKRKSITSKSIQKSSQKDEVVCFCCRY